MSRTIRWAAAVAATALLAACAPSTSTPTGPGGPATPGADCATPTKLRVWSWRTEDVAAYNRIFGAFTAKNPCITVDFQAFKNTEYNQILQTGLTGSDGPDVAHVRTYGQLQPLVEGKNLVALDEVVPDALKMDAAIIAGGKGRSDGKLYGVPFASQTVQVFYNKEIFEKNGIAVPTTWDEFVAANQKLKAAGVTPMAVGGKDAWMMPIVHEVLGSARFGGAEFEKDVLAGKKDFTDPNYVASLQVVKDMQPFMPADVVGVGYADSQVMFTNGLAAMFPGGAFELAFFTKENPQLKLGVFQVPPPPAACSTTRCPRPGPTAASA